MFDTKPFPPVTDRNEDGSADLCSQCERPSDYPLKQVAHAGGTVYLCGVCFDELPPCENCGERGGTAKTVEDRDDSVGYCVMVECCTLCCANLADGR